MKFKNKFAHKSNYGPTRPLSNIKPELFMEQY